MHIRDETHRLAKEYKGIRFAVANETENQDAVNVSRFEFFFFGFQSKIKFNFKKLFRLHVDNDTEITPVCINQKSEFFVFDKIRDTFIYSEISKFVSKFNKGKCLKSISIISYEKLFLFI